MRSERITVIGASGLVGKKVVEGLKETNAYTIITPGSSELDITNPHSIDAFLRRYPYGPIFNCGAYTNTKDADQEKYQAWRLNVEGVCHLAEAAIAQNRFLIHASTDYVKNGLVDNKGPYGETSRPDKDLRGWYPITKAMAEEMLARYQAEGLRCAILRLAYPYGNRLFGKDYLEKMLEWIKFGRRFVDDQNITPTYIPDIAKAVDRISQSQVPGTYHVASPEVTTPYKFACYVAHLIGYPRAIHPMKLAELNGSGILQFGGLNTVQTEQKLGVKFHTWKEGLNQLLAQGY